MRRAQIGAPVVGVVEIPGLECRYPPAASSAVDAAGRYSTQPAGAQSLVLDAIATRLPAATRLLPGLAMRLTSTRLGELWAAWVTADAPRRGRHKRITFV
jgi:hypothetical protein